MTSPTTGSADLVITGADVWTGDTTRSWSDAVAVQGDRVVALGAAEAGDLVGPRTRVIHAPGSMVVPGFQDAHVHAPFAGRNRLHVWLNDLTGRQAYLDRIADYARANPDEPWIVGGGWAMEHFPGGLPLKEDLDAVVPDRPVFLMNRGVHGAWVNSRALELAGITAGTADPADGRIERDPRTGEPTGALHEGAAYSFKDRHVPLPSAPRAGSGRSWRRQGHLHSLGITGWQDAWVTPATLEAYRSLGAAGRLTARVVGALWWDRHRGLEQVTDFLDPARGAAPSAGFHPTTVKIMTDGVLENHTGALLEPYCDGCGGQTDNHGLSYVDRELLARRGHPARPPRLPGAPARHRGPGRAQRAGRRRGGPRRERSRRPPAPHRPHPGDPARGRAAVPPARRGGQRPGVLGPDGAADGGAHHPVPRPRPGPPAVPLRRPAAVRGDARDGQRLVGHHRRPAPADRGRGDPGRPRQPVRRAVPARAGAAAAGRAGAPSRPARRT